MMLRFVKELDWQVYVNFIDIATRIVTKTGKIQVHDRLLKMTLVHALRLGPEMEAWRPQNRPLVAKRRVSQTCRT